MPIFEGTKKSLQMGKCNSVGAVIRVVGIVGIDAGTIAEFLLTSNRGSCKTARHSPPNWMSIDNDENKIIHGIRSNDT
jgi:hypothetical protein